MGAKVVPKGSQKMPKETTLWLEWISENNGFTLLSKTIIFEVLEVSGEDLETLSETKGDKGALERRLRLPFCRFGQIFEILRVPLGDYFALNF